MNRRQIPAYIFLILLTFLIFPVKSTAQELKVRVKVEKANIRLRPSMDSQIVTQVVLGTIFTVLDTTGQWYLVEHRPENSDFTLSGYIHEGIVEIISGAPPAQEAQAPPPAEQRAAPPPPVPTGKLPRDLDQMMKIEKSMRRGSLAFLSLIKKMEPEETAGTQDRTVEMVRVVIDGCQVYETMDTSTTVIYVPRINDEFEILDRNDGFYRILLPDGREGWISEQCIQVFSIQKQQPVIRFQGVESKEVKRYLDTATDIFANLTQQKQFADQIYKKAASSGPGQERIFQISYTKIQKYFRYAREFHGKFVEHKSFQADGATLLSKLSAWTEFLLGPKSYGTEYLLEDAVNNSGMIYDLSAGGNLTLNQKSRVAVKFRKKSDIIQTPYDTLNVDAGYSYRNKDKLSFNLGANLNTYNDQLSDYSDFKRMSLRSDIDYQMSAQSRLRVDYAFLRNTFTLNPDNSYNNHRIRAAAKWKSGSRSEFTLQMRSNLQSSQSDLYQFTNLEPSIAFDRFGVNSRMTVRAFYDMLSYSGLKLRSFNRAVFQFRSHSSSSGTNSLWDLSLMSKNYPNNKSSSYLQMRGSYARTRGGRLKMRFAPSFTTNLYSDNSDNSFTDLRMDLSTTTSAFFTSISSFFRLWHSPGDPDVENAVVKPYILDVYGRLGLNLKYFKIGPTFGMHALFSSENDVEFFKRDGNLIRFGGMVEGNIPFPSGIFLTLRGTYEYGFVYNNEIDIDVNTGDITTGDLFLRHPTTFQINSTLRVPLYKNLILLGRVNYYKIATDMDEKLSIRPVTQNTRFVALAGISYRYN
jgi:uncharacterized protein YgiM (DUF1202 family)